MFHHTNVSFKGEKILSYLFIVPSLHRVHHATERHKHNSNYGVEPPKPKHCINAAVLEQMIAEAAYYKAEKRNFTPDHEIHDWLEAKIEIVGKVRGDKDFTVFANSTPDVLTRSDSLIARFISSVVKKQPVDYLYLR